MNILIVIDDPNCWIIYYGVLFYHRMASVEACLLDFVMIIDPHSNHLQTGVHA